MWDRITQEERFTLCYAQILVAYRLPGFYSSLDYDMFA